MTTFIFESPNEDETRRLGGALAEVLSPGTVIALDGTLGAGKTRLVRAIALGLDVDKAAIASPTFVLLHEYEGRMPVYHFDAYRLTGAVEFDQLGAEEYLASEGITLIEWAEKIVTSLPEERINIRIEVAGDSARRFSFSSNGTLPDEILAKLQSRLAS